MAVESDKPTNSYASENKLYDNTKQNVVSGSSNSSSIEQSDLQIQHTDNSKLLMLKVNQPGTVLNIDKNNNSVMSEQQQFQTSTPSSSSLIMSVSNLVNQSSNQVFQHSPITINTKYVSALTPCQASNPICIPGNIIHLNLHKPSKNFQNTQMQRFETCILVFFGFRYKLVSIHCY